MTKPVTVYIIHHAFGPQIFLDGKEITAEVEALELKYGKGQRPKLTLHLAPEELVIKSEVDLEK